MNNVTRTHNERSKAKEEQELTLFFLDDDYDETVHVEEAKEYDLSKVTRHLNSRDRFSSRIEEDPGAIQIPTRGFCETRKDPTYLREG